MSYFVLINNYQTLTNNLRTNAAMFTRWDSKSHELHFLIYNTPVHIYFKKIHRLIVGKGGGVWCHYQMNVAHGSEKIKEAVEHVFNKLQNSLGFLAVPKIERTYYKTISGMRHVSKIQSLKLAAFQLRFFESEDALKKACGLMVDESSQTNFCLIS